MSCCVGDGYEDCVRPRGSRIRYGSRSVQDDGELLLLMPIGGLRDRALQPGQGGRWRLDSIGLAGVACVQRLYGRDRGLDERWGLRPAHTERLATPLLVVMVGLTWKLGMFMLQWVIKMSDYISHFEWNALLCAAAK